MNERMRRLRQIQSLGFGMIETGLFLDGQPEDQAAMDYYRQLRAAKEQAVAEYEAAYGPLTIEGAEGDRWAWVDGPWPWEMED